LLLRALIAFALLASLTAAGCGGDDAGSEDLAGGKVFDQSQLTDCLRDQDFRIDRRGTDTGIDFTAVNRSGLLSADIAIERTPDDAQAREDSWKELAAQANVENIDDYYFRYGNVVLAYERVPSESDRAKLERCLS
jgi:hypothetical protein